MKPKIGIVATALEDKNTGLERVHVSMNYVNAIKKAGGIPLVLPVVIDTECFNLYTDILDGFLFSGGYDISPICYGEDPHPLLGPTNLKVDTFQIELMKKALATTKPVLAICRGIQVLNVACGGTLYQDCSLHTENVLKHMQETANGDGSHIVKIAEDSKLHSIFGDEVFTNSYHHQSVKAIGSGLRAIAWAADGIVEAVEHIDHPFAIGVQWHPEMMFAVSDEMKPIFESFVIAARENFCKN